MTAFVVLEEETGEVVRAGLAPLEDVENQPLKAGQRLVVTDELLSSLMKLDLKFGVFVPSEEKMKRKEAVEKEKKAAEVLTAPFMSGKRLYLIDRMGLLEACFVGGNLECQEDGVWLLRAHTPAEAVAVLLSYVKRGVLPDAGGIAVP